MNTWTWPFELDGETLTSVEGPDIKPSGKAFRKRNKWFGNRRDESLKPKYPIYILSKGRWDLHKTWKVLDAMKVRHTVVVEPQEYEQYVSSLSRFEHIAVMALPEDFRSKYRGELEESGGGIPARNFIWEHSISIGAKRHWIMDDNLHCFQRLHRRERQELWAGAGFKALEDFVDRYENVALAGPEYISFSNPKKTKVPYRLNTRIYSCILINNVLPFRWRGKYNEDTDLSLRALKSGWCTVLANAFLVDKTTTGRCSGGNTDTIYSDWQKNREEMCDALVKLHPDIVMKKRKWGRYQHEVDYSGFAQRLKKINPNAPEIVSEYGLRQRRKIQ